MLTARHVWQPDPAPVQSVANKPTHIWLFSFLIDCSRKDGPRVKRFRWVGQWQRREECRDSACWSRSIYLARVPITPPGLLTSTRKNKLKDRWEPYFMSLIKSLSQPSFYWRRGSPGLVSGAGGIQIWRTWNRLPAGNKSEGLDNTQIVFRSFIHQRAVVWFGKAVEHVVGEKTSGSRQIQRVERREFSNKLCHISLASSIFFHSFSSLVIFSLVPFHSSARSSGYKRQRKECA